MACFSLDGFVVCKEHEEILLTAWDEEQELQRQKDLEVRSIFSISA